MDQATIERLAFYIRNLAKCSPEYKTQFWCKFEGFLEGLCYADVITPNQYQYYWDRGFTAYVSR